MKQDFFDRQSSCCRQSGNVIFFILIAVALFAGLSYTVTNSMKGGGKSIDGDKAKLAALQFISAADSTEKALNRVMMVNDCQITQVSFAPATVGSNVNAPSDGRCNVFDPRGGQANYVPMPGKYFTNNLDADWVMYSGISFSELGKVCADSTCTDLIFYIRRVNKDICLAINNLVGVKNPNGSPPNVAELSGGSFTNGSLAFAASVTEDELKGKTEACAYEAGCGSGSCNAYYRVVHIQ